MFFIIVLNDFSKQSHRQRNCHPLLQRQPCCQTFSFLPLMAEILNNEYQLKCVLKNTKKKNRFLCFCMPLRNAIVFLNQHLKFQMKCWRRSTFWHFSFLLKINSNIFAHLLLLCLHQFKTFPLNRPPTEN